MNKKDEVVYLLKQMSQIVLDARSHGILDHAEMERIVAIYADLLDLKGPVRNGLYRPHTPDGAALSERAINPL